MTRAVKVFRLGTHRVAAPGETLARVLPMARRMGVTRLAVLTGLDVLGIPTVAAIRPNSRSVAQHQGKGVTLDAAKASAVMEAAEAFHAERFSGPLRLATCEEMAETADVADPARLPGARGPVAERLLWAEGRDLATGRALWAPYELVSTDYTEPRIESRFHGTSNGLASGNTSLEAVLHGLYEVIERDADAVFLALREADQDARAVDLGSVDGPCAELLAAFARAGVRLRAWDQTTDVGLPVFRCMAAPAGQGDPVEPELGYGCHADRDIALSRALTEVAQARLTRISGARDDMSVSGFGEASKARSRDAARRWFATPPRRRFGDVPSSSAETLEDDLDHVLRALAAVGCGQAAHIDLTRPEFGIAVARVIVPGLEGPWTEPGEGYEAGPRAKAAA